MKTINVSHTKVKRSIILLTILYIKKMAEFFDVNTEVFSLKLSLLNNRTKNGTNKKINEETFVAKARPNNMEFFTTNDSKDIFLSMNSNVKYIIPE